MHRPENMSFESSRKACLMKEAKPVGETPWAFSQGGDKQMSKELVSNLSLRLRACVDCLVENMLNRRKEKLFGEWIPWENFV